MKCHRCHKEYQTYNGICPFCHTKNEKLTQAQPTIRYTPTVKPKPSDVSLHPFPNGGNPSKTKKTSGDSLKYILMGGIILIVVLSVAAVAQSFIGGSTLSASTPDGYVSSTSTDVPIPSLAPITSSTQPKITYSGSKAGTLSPYSGDSDSSNPNPVAPDYTAPGHRSTPNMLPAESTSTGSNGRSTAVYVTSSPATIVTVSPPKAVEPPRSQPAALVPVSSPPKVVEPPKTPSNAVEPTVTPPIVVEPQEHQVGTVFGKLNGGFNPDYDYHVILSAEYDADSNSDWIYSVLKVYEYPNGNGWYAVSGEQPTEQLEDGMYYDSGYSWFPTGEMINVKSIPRESTVIQFPTLKYQEYDIVQTTESDGKIKYSLIYSCSSSGDYEGVYYTCEIRKKADGNWGYVLDDKYLSLSSWEYQRGFEDRVIQFDTHLSNDHGIEPVGSVPKVM